jgi:flagellar biosynthesis protein FliR
MFMGAMRVAIPGVIALLAVNLAMGVATRAAPQLNIFSVGLPVSVMAGLVVLLLGVEAFINGWLGVIADSIRATSGFWAPGNV